MKHSTFLTRLFWLLMLVFCLGRVGFMVYNQALWPSAADPTITGFNSPTWYIDMLSACFHGAVANDLVTACLICLLPALLCFAEVSHLRRWLTPYYIIIAIAMGLCFIGDTILYEFWQFKLNRVVLVYASYPEGTTNSVSPAFIGSCVGAFAGFVVVVSALCILITPRRVQTPASARSWLTVLITLVAFGVVASQSSVGAAHFSNRIFLNHSAVNSFYGFVASFDVRDYPDRYNYFPEEERATIMVGLYEGNGAGITSAPSACAPSAPIKTESGAEATPDSLAADTLKASSDPDANRDLQKGKPAKESKPAREPKEPKSTKQAKSAKENQAGSKSWQQAKTTAKAAGSTKHKKGAKVSGAKTAADTTDRRPASVAPAAIEPLLRTRRPDVLVVFMEGFGSEFVSSLGGAQGTNRKGQKEDVDQQLERLIPEGIFWTNYYNASFRTDRGVVSAFCGWPAYTDFCLMPHTEFHDALPSLPKSFGRAGYTTSYLYSGAMTNMGQGTFLGNVGFGTLLDDKAFTPQELTASWGAEDMVSARRVAHLLTTGSTAKPRFFVYQTISSHEPWDVPYSRLTDKVQNAFAYTDAAIGTLIDSLKASPVWDNLLVIIVPDHGHLYKVATKGSGTLHHQAFDDAEFFHSPMLWLGGAIAGPRRMDVLMSQTDLAATLLGQMGIDHTDYPWSRDVLSPSYTYPFVYAVYPCGILFRDATGTTLYDVSANRLTLQHDANGTPAYGPAAPTTEAAMQRLRNAKAILQTTYDGLKLL